MSDKKIVLLIIGGVGGVQSGPNMLTELQQSHRPNLNALVRKSVCGLLHPVGPGIVPDKKTALRNLLGYGAGTTKAAASLSFNKRYHRKTVLVSPDAAYQKVARALAIPVFRCDTDLAACFVSITEVYDRYDFIILHIDAPAHFSLGEYYEKIKAIEELDFFVQELVKLQPQVIAVTGDYSQPTAMGKVTWHPVPVMIHSEYCRYDAVQTFDEVACLQGGLGIISSRDLLPLLLANCSY
jgi:2,3-bisphosphoglycerate-independent phosphoglycerate mutase